MGKLLAELQRPGAPQHLGDGSAASAISLQSLLMPEPWLPCPPGKKASGENNHDLLLISGSAGEQRQCGGESESCFHGNWSLKKVYRNQCHLSMYVSVQPHSNKKLFSCHYHEIMSLWDCPDQTCGSKWPRGARNCRVRAWGSSLYPAVSSSTACDLEGKKPP